MRRCAVLLALAACGVEASPPAAPPAWLYAPNAPVWPLGRVTGTIGRSQPPQLVMRAGIAGAPAAPLRSPTVWEVPGDGPARAVVYGSDGGGAAIELVDLDAGRVVWRDARACTEPVVGVTSEVAVCAGASGVHAIGLDGQPRWARAASFAAMTGDRIAIGDGGDVVVLGAARGDERARVRLPAGVRVEEIVAACDGGELFAATQDGRLARVTGARLAWSAPVPGVDSVDACDGTSVLVTARGEAGAALVAFARDTGKVTGRVDGVRGAWPARDGSARIEVSAAGGIAAWERDLAGPPRHVPLPALGELLARRGDRRLVRASPLTAVLLDAAGVVAYVPFAADAAALGDSVILGGSWRGSPAHAVWRVELPPRYARALRVPRPRAPARVPAELRDLPPPVTAGEPIVPPPGAPLDAGAIALDPDDPRALYVATVARGDDGSVRTGLARVALPSGAWAWQRDDACGDGEPVGVAVAREVVTCAARRVPGRDRPAEAWLRAVGRDGAPRWEWRTEHVDAIAAGGDLVLAWAGDRLTVIGAADGRALGAFTSDDGAPARAAALDVGGASLLVVAERGRVVARLPRAGMVPAWSLAVAGVVRALATSGDGVLVELEDGDAYRIAARDGAAVALPGLDLAWTASGELVLGQAIGGPVPPDPMPEGPPTARPADRDRRAPGRARSRRADRSGPAREPAAPAIAVPWPPPPPMEPSWQLSIYELAGGLRTRNDYALMPPVALAAARGPAGSPLVVAHAAGELLVIDARGGDPMRRVRLPEDAGAAIPFSTVVDGAPIVGAVLANPLRLVLFSRG